MYKICLFAGTSEGRELAEFLRSQPVSVDVRVATDYGETLIPEGENVRVSAGRLGREEMERLFAEERFDVVIDSTHPYAEAVTETISAASQAAGVEYLRLLRGASEVPEDAVFVSDAAEAVEFLSSVEGTVLLTTGSKELHIYAGMAGFGERVFARVLPMEASLDACREAGLKPARIIAMQGPFSLEMNEAMLRHTGAKWLVTKDGGEPGGFRNKAEAAEKLGVRLVVIGRPPQREGLGFSQVAELLCERFGCVRRPQVTVVGLGPGSGGGMTFEVREAIDSADCLIGAKRMLEAVMRPGQPIFDAIRPEDMVEFIRSHREYRSFAVVMSGDVGFFSGAKKLLPMLGEAEVRVLPGLSSLVTLCARLGESYEDVKVFSIHGREGDIVSEIRRNRRLFVLVGGENGMGKLCERLSEAGLGHVRMGIGERLSYPDERITRGTAEELRGEAFHSLAVALVENDGASWVVTHGLPDSAFRRGGGEEGVVPMTKSEVRSVCLSKLQLTNDALCWDVGAGTGSVAIEMALQAREGHVWAVEMKDAAVELLGQNKERLGAENLTIVKGRAPDACRDLPAPTHVFIGGSSGSMRELIALALSKNPKVRIVATAISLESVADLTACMKEFAPAAGEAVCLSVARTRKAGSYNLMTAQNPIYVFTMGK